MNIKKLEKMVVQKQARHVLGRAYYEVTLAISKEALTAKEICSKTGLKYLTVWKALNKLRKENKLEIFMLNGKRFYCVQDSKRLSS